MNPEAPKAAAEQAADKPAARFSFWGLAEALGAVATTCTVAGFVGEVAWLLELTTHFRLQYLVLLTGLAVLLAVGKRFKTAAVFLVGGLLNAIVLAPWLLPGSAQRPAGIAFRVMILNVNTENSQHERVLGEIRRVQPDVLLLMEVDTRWLRALRELTNSLPHAVLAPREDNFGIALFSRQPLASSDVVETGEAGVPSIISVTEVGGRKLLLVGTHPLPPSNPENARLRNEQLDKLASVVVGQKLPAVMMGDLNATPWSPHFRKLERSASLRDTSRDAGWRPTWPTSFPPLWIPLDHCLVSPELGVASRTIGNRVGSDHYPVIVDLVLPRDAQRN